MQMWDPEHIYIAVFSCTITGLLATILLYIRTIRGDIKKQVETNTKDLCDVRIALPLEYVRKEDWIRRDVSINDKLDCLAVKIDEIRGIYERGRSAES